MCFEWFWCRFVSNLLEYIYADNYFTVKRFDKVIAKNKMMHIFAPQCSLIKRLDEKKMKNAIVLIDKRKTVFLDDFYQ